MIITKKSEKSEKRSSNIPHYPIKLWIDTPPRVELPTDLSFMFKLVKPLVERKIRDSVKLVTELYKSPKIGNLYLSLETFSESSIVKVSSSEPPDIRLDLITIFENYDNYTFDIGNDLLIAVAETSLIDTKIYDEYRYYYNIFSPQPRNMEIRLDSLNVRIYNDERTIFHIPNAKLERYISLFLGIYGLMIFPLFFTGEISHHPINMKQVVNEYKYFIGSEEVDVFTPECPDLRDVILPLLIGYAVNGIPLDADFSRFSFYERKVVNESLKRVALHFVVGVFDEVRIPERMFSLITEVPPENYSHILFPKMYTDWALFTLNEKEIFQKFPERIS